MAWEWFEAYRHLLPIFVTLLSALLALGLSARGRPIWLATIVAAVIPSVLILVGFMYWDAQQPYGGFLSLTGLLEASYNLIFGLLGATSAALYRVLRRELLSIE